MMSTESRMEHESFGTVRISRVTHGGSRNVPLFMSPMIHDHTVILSIHHASLRRCYGENRVYSENAPLVEVEMSESQFAQMITSLNIGEGSPCTIRSFGEEDYDYPPAIATKKTHSQELRQELEGTAEKLRDVYERIEELFADRKTLKREDKAAVLSALREASNMFSDGVPFAQDQFARAMEKVVAVAKTEIGATAAAAIERAGINALKSEMPKMIGEGEQD